MNMMQQRPSRTFPARPLTRLQVMPAQMKPLQQNARSSQGTLAALGWTLAALAMALVPGCGGCEESVIAIAPQIAVNVCATPDIKIDGVSKGGVEECGIDFGVRDISVRHEFTVQVANPSTIDLKIESVEFVQESGVAFDPAFRVEIFPATVGSGITTDLVISYRPNTETEVNGVLRIRTDAENLPRESDATSFRNLDIPVKGTGVDNGVPDISITPESCDFGRVAKDSVATCSLTVENLGNRPLVLDSVTILSGADELVVPADSTAEAFAFFGRPPTEDDAIAPPPDNNAISITFRFTPDVLGGYFGQVRIASNDPDQPEILVPLEGIGVDPPSCAVKVTTVNGIEAGSAPTIEPLDDVRLSAVDSIPSVVDGSIASVQWTIVDQPSGSTVTLTDPSGIETGFTFANGVQGLDLAGRYRVRAVVVDDLGTESVNECEVQFEAVPTDTILAQLSWDTSFGDMDLHLILKDDQDRYCSASSFDGSLVESCGNSDQACYYGNCKASSSSRPDWDANGMSGTSGDPSLDIDDLCGYGPENINIDLAVPGDYLVGVDFFGFTGCSGSGAVGNTLRLYLFGQLQAEFYKELNNGDFWEVAVVHWRGIDGGPPCIEDLSTTELECPNDPI